MEIDITGFLTNAEPFEYSGSRMERGDNAAKETWNNALDAAKEAPLLADDQLDEFRRYVKSFGAWDDEEIAAWSPAECNALLIQMISGDMREAGFDSCDLDEFDWEGYEKDSQAGQVAGRIFKGVDERIYYYIGE